MVALPTYPPSTPDDAAIETEHVERVDGPLRDEIAGFLASLTEERQFFMTGLDEVLRSELLILARVDGELAGLTGINRRFVHLPFGYYVVRRDRQGAGVAKALYRAKRPFLHRYLCVFAVILSDNRRTVAWAKRRDDYVFHDDGQLAWVASSQRRLVGKLIGGALRIALPPALAVHRGYRQLQARVRSAR